MSDPINHPEHYTVGGIETIDFMKAKSSEEEFLGHLRLTAMKYLSRGPFKEDALKDYKKAAWYLNRLIKELEESRLANNSQSSLIVQYPVEPGDIKITPLDYMYNEIRKTLSNDTNTK